MQVKARIHQPTTAAILRLARVLRRGGLVAVPSETVYGLAADALNSAACRRIFAAKGRPSTDPLIVHVATLRAASEVAEWNEAAQALARAFWPGPLTLVLPKKAVVPDVVTAGLDSVAVRQPNHAVFRALLRATGRPLAAPSANPFGYISPTTAEHVRESLGERIAHILDGGPCRVGVESTIVDLRNPARPRVLRPGWITAEQVASVLGCRVAGRGRRPAAGKRSGRARATADQAVAQVAPGMLTRHYSPRIPLTLVKRITSRDDRPGVARLFYQKPRTGPAVESKPAAPVAWLSETGDPAEAARHLFSRLRALDRSGATSILAESAPDTAEGRVLNDRLRRAAAR